MDHYSERFLEGLYSHEAEERARATITAQIEQSGQVAAQQARLEMLGSAVLKLYGPCNLACDYCYEYEGPDQSWLELPSEMSEETITASAHAFSEYANAHSLEQWDVVFHGGEALMIGVDAIDQAAGTLRTIMESCAPNTQLNLSVVTNGVLLTDRMLRVLDKHGIRVIVSLDGGEQAHNRHRINKAGAGTYRSVARGIDRLRNGYNHLFGGLLCVIDPENDPLEVYESLCAFDPPDIDFLLPYANWDNPPPAYRKYPERNPGTPYADWLIPIFDKWQKDRFLYGCNPDTYRKPPGIRFFQSIIDMNIGGLSSTEAIGPYAGNEFVIRPGGSIELADGLKSTYEGAVKTDMNIHADDLETIASRLRVMEQLGRKSLAFDCEICPIRDICGGGHIATRYWQDSFLAPSVYCSDLMAIVNYICDNVSYKLEEAQLIADDRLIIHKIWSKGPVARYLRGDIKLP